MNTIAKPSTPCSRRTRRTTLFRRLPLLPALAAIAAWLPSRVDAAEDSPTPDVTAQDVTAPAAPNPAAPPDVTASPAPDLPASTPADAVTSPAPAPRNRFIGLSTDVGLPDGLALGVSVRPWPWLRLGVSATYNALAPGLRAGFTVDPLPTVVAPTFTFEGGHAFGGRLPGVRTMPSVSYDYVNLHLGLEFGRRSSFRVFLRGGASWVALGANGTENSGIASATLSNLSYHGWLVPSAKAGFSLYF
jgi:hypothetical protein